MLQSHTQGCDLYRGNRERLCRQATRNAITPAKVSSAGLLKDLSISQLELLAVLLIDMQPILMVLLLHMLL